MCHLQKIKMQTLDGTENIKYISVTILCGFSADSRLFKVSWISFDIKSVSISKGLG